MATNPFKVYEKDGHIIIEDPVDRHSVYVDDTSNPEHLRVEALVGDADRCATFVCESRQIERHLQAMELYAPIGACSPEQEYRWQSM